MSDDVEHTLYEVPDKFGHGYEIDVHGNVYSTSHNWRGRDRHSMSIELNSDGYPSVRLTNDSGNRTRYTIHKIMAAVFLPDKPSDRHEIRHMDGDKTNNHPSNLSWGTRKDNARDRERHGNTSRGKSHSQAIKRGLKEVGFEIH